MGQGQDCSAGLHSPVHLSLPHGTFASPQRFDSDDSGGDNDNYSF